MAVRLVLCLTASLVVSQVSSQAPGDHDETCRTGINRPAHIFPSDWEILMDTRDYNNLFQGRGAPWVKGDFDTDITRQFVQVISGQCNWQMRTESCQSSIPQNNWLFSQYISYENTNEIFINITYDFSLCRAEGCSKPYVTLRRFDTDAPVSDTVRRTTGNYNLGLVGDQPTRLEQPPSADRAVGMTLNMVRPSVRRRGFYLGIHDEGTCGSVIRIIMYYRVVHGRTQTLLTCPDVPLPPLQQPQSTSQGLCTCAPNASPAPGSTLQRTCRTDSTCNENQDCACSPGFEFNSGNCRACPEGMYKFGISNSTCLQCPANSENRGSNNSICSCIPPHQRDPEKPSDPCTIPPSSPRLIPGRGGAPQVGVGSRSITVCWLPAINSGGLNNVHYNIYLYDTNQDNPIFNKVNPEGIMHERSASTNNDRICYEATGVDPQTSYGVVVVSANGATGNPPTLTNLEAVQNRSVVFFVALGSDLAPRCELAGAVVGTLLLTALVTAGITTLVVVLVMKFCFNKSQSSTQDYSRKSEPSSKPSNMNYHAGSEKVDISREKMAPHPRKPPPRPPTKPSYA